ncbi:dipeptidase [Sporofaciens musculi]|uniref:dipeptidase n=1 Tax=Sporofaciens musculi TaxID=2681861 RepID=UPI00258DF285|nr:dipeptidase [Sporofaciens musculi]
MKLIDLHCDTLWKLMDMDKDGDLMENQCSVSIPFMKKAGTKAQFFACFTCLKDFEHAGGYEGCYRRVQDMIAYLNRQVQTYPEQIGIARSFQDMQENESQGKISAFLTVEEGGVLNGEMRRLYELYEKGVRLVTLLWNYENCIGHPNSRDGSIMSRGLTPFGIDVVRRMDELGMIVDVSHASDGTFFDILKYSRKPVVASHSNCRTLCNHPRNLTDEMIRSLAETGGVAGLNFYGAFLGTGKREDADAAYEDSRIDGMTAHILHMIRVGGSDFPAIGTDFDGFDGGKTLEIPDASRMERLWDALERAGVSQGQLDKLWGDNAKRVIREVL